MHDAGTVLGGDIVSGDHAESALVRTEPGDELLVADLEKVRALVLSRQHIVRDELVPGLVGVKGHLGGLGIEPGADQRLCQHVHGLAAGIGIVRTDADIIDVRAHAKGGVGRQCPGGGGPGEDVEREALLEEALGTGVANDLELHGGSGVLHVAVAARLVELMGAEAGSGRRRIRLDGLALVQVSLSVDVLEKVPEGLDIAVVVSDVRVVHIDPVADALRKVAPLGGVLHHFLAAGVVVLLHAYLVADILLGDAELLLDAKLYGQSVGVPPGAALHPEARLCLITADRVLDGAGHNVMDARHSVRGRGSFEEDELGSAFPQLEGFLERVILLPSLQSVISDRDQIQALILFECHIFYLILHPDYGPGTVLFIVCKYNQTKRF